MVTIIKEIEKDWFLIQLDGTNIYQIWNRFEFLEILLERGQNILDKDLITDEIQLDKIFQHTKEIKEFENKLNKE
jgi:hypothetical protein